MNLSLAADGGTVEISEEAFAREFNESLVHQVVVAHMAGARQGSRAHKTRADVRGVSGRADRAGALPALQTRRRLRKVR